MGKPAPKQGRAGGTDPAVDAFLAQLKHPLQPEIATVRAWILATNAAISEGIKWNAPSFRTTQFFATVNLRSVDRVQLIFHLGAKVRPDLPAFKLADPAGLLKWLGKDRALVTLGAGQELAANRAAFGQIVREWIQHV